MTRAEPVRKIELPIAVIRLSSFARLDSRGRLSPQKPDYCGEGSTR